MTDHVYRLYDEHGGCLYVGCAGDVLARLRTHAARPWWTEVAQVRVTAHATRRAALREERALIRTLRPRWNIRHRGPRSGWSQRDYAEVLQAFSVRCEGEGSWTDSNRRTVARIAREFGSRYPDTAAAVLPSLGIEEAA